MCIQITYNEVDAAKYVSNVAKNMIEIIDVRKQWAFAQEIVEAHVTISSRSCCLLIGEHKLTDRKDIKDTNQQYHPSGIVNKTIMFICIRGIFE